MDHFSVWAWAAFILFVSLMLAIDLGVFRKKSDAHDISMKEAVTWCIIWFGMAMAFNGYVLYSHGKVLGMQWLTSYIVEICLSVDNLFVFILVFTYFKVPSANQHRVLFWGIIGAAVMRAVFILVGVEMIARFHWIIYVFGVFLVVTGIKLALPKKEDDVYDPEKTFAVKAVRKCMPVVTDAPPDRFFVRHQGKLAATPLFIVLAVIETTDLAFALDSIPAVLAITSNSFIAFTSNIFAILGLRSLYFALRGFMNMFRFLNMGLAVVLTFIGTKMLIAEIYKVTTGMSLAVIGGVLAVAIIASLLFPDKSQPKGSEGKAGPLSH